MISPTEPAIPAAATLEDWASWEGRWELIDGVPFPMTPAPVFRHQDVAYSVGFALGLALLEAIREGRLVEGKVVAGPLDCFLGESVVEPDLVVLRDRSRQSRRGVEGPPDLVVEVLSPRTAARDRGLKLDLYRRAGVAEVLIVDPRTLEGTLLRRVRGRYVEAARVAWGGELPLLGGELPCPLGHPVLGPAPGD